MSDETWAGYRAQRGATPISVALGKLVEREVASHRRRTSLDAEGVKRAVEDARAVAQELASLVARLEENGQPPTSRVARAHGTAASDAEKLF